MNKVQEIHNKLRELRDLVKSHADEATDPDCKTLCDTTFEVLAGLEEEYDTYLDEHKK